MTVVLRLVVFVAALAAATLAWLASGLLLDYVNVESILLRGLSCGVILSVGVYIGIRLKLLWLVSKAPRK